MPSLDLWHNFYSLLGSASATLAGLMFIAASVRSGVFTPSRADAQRVFLSASLVNFAGVLVASLIMLAPLPSLRHLSLAIAAAATTGLAYYALAWRGLIRDGLILKLDWEDRTWYTLLPILAYGAEAAAGLTLPTASNTGASILALSLLGLLVIAIHNAWDITIWSITRQKE